MASKYNLYRIILLLIIWLLTTYSYIIHICAYIQIQDTGMIGCWPLTVNRGGLVTLTWLVMSFTDHIWSSPIKTKWQLVVAQSWCIIVQDLFTVHTLGHTQFSTPSSCFQLWDENRLDCLLCEWVNGCCLLMAQSILWRRAKLLPGAHIEQYSAKVRLSQSQCKHLLKM